MKTRSISLREFSHVPRKVGEQVQRRIDALKIGQKMQDLPEELWHESFRFYVKQDPSRNGGPNLRIIRLDPNRPSLTVTGYVFNKFVHPTENRYITPREAARLQGFPDDFLFVGTLTSMQRQVGNAVPVHLARAVGKQILEHIEQYHPLGLGVDVFPSRRFPVVSLFSGAGGMDVGVTRSSYKKSVFQVKTCVELDHDCCDTLRKNFGKRTRIMERDISTLNPKSVIEECGFQNDPLPLVIGGPPCQSFSQAGKQKGVRDPRGGLIFEFLRFVRETKPVYFVMENVSNLRGVGKGELLRDIENDIDGMGYNFTRNLLCAADYGSPQLRRRLVFMGVRKPYPAVQPPMPTHGGAGEELFGIKPYVGVGEAFVGLPSLDGSDEPSALPSQVATQEVPSQQALYHAQGGSQRG